MNLPIFPLPIFLLPQGRTRLRVFQPKYIRLIKIAAQNQGFIIVFKNEKDELSDIHWGSWVNIVNFDQGKDNTLHIDIECRAIVNLSKLSQESDGLFFAEAVESNHWPTIDVDNNLQGLSTSLKDLFSHHQLLNELYQDKAFDQANWVVARWLELIPLEANIKRSFVEKDSYTSAKDFVQSILSVETQN